MYKVGTEVQKAFLRSTSKSVVVMHWMGMPRSKLWIPGRQEKASTAYQPIPLNRTSSPFPSTIMVGLLLCVFVVNRAVVFPAIAPVLGVA